MMLVAFVLLLAVFRSLRAAYRFAPSTADLETGSLAVLDDHRRAPGCKEVIGENMSRRAVAHESARRCVDVDGYLLCPRRGEIDVQWCLGCPRRVRVSHRDGRTVVACEPGSERSHDHQAGPLRDVPEPFKIY
jgi:hypothetical protein